MAFAHSYTNLAKFVTPETSLIRAKDKWVVSFTTKQSSKSPAFTSCKRSFAVSSHTL
jgi:hypothetical protein